MITIQLVTTCKRFAFFQYFKDTGMTDEDLQKRMQSCSRHRATFAPPSTPEHFWSIGFMDTPECEERGENNYLTQGDHLGGKVVVSSPQV